MTKRNINISSAQPQPEIIPTYGMDNSLWLPTSAKEVEALGYGQLDVILFSGDAYVDHPSFGAAVIGRTLQANGYKVAIVPQPNWRDDLRDFRKLGKPKLFFGISAGAMDSMVNHYTAARRLRSDDAYTPGGKHGMRPDYPTIVYAEILRKLYPDVPIVAGGIEASMRRLSHYDYWQNRLRPSILADAPIDMISYGMGEKSILEIAHRLKNGENIASITDIRQTAIIMPLAHLPAETDRNNIVLNPYTECLKDKRKQSANFKHIEQQANKFDGGATLWQQLSDQACVKVNPMYTPLTTEEIDKSYDLPYTRMPHPRYRGKRIPAYDMIRHSLCMHRGCFGGCSFCTISAHQGKFIASRSKASILKEARAITMMPDFKGYISDLGGPSANMYGMGGHDKGKCAVCMRPSCLHPSPCPNLNTSHKQLLEIYHEVDKLPGLKKSFVGSGVRYDLAMHKTGIQTTDNVNAEYCSELIRNHVSGRLKVAPEHTSDFVLNIMRKPSFKQFYQFKSLFDRINQKNGLRQQLIPYFISSHPGCSEADMAQLAADTRNLGMHLEQVQDFTPTPMTVSTEIYYSGYHPYTGEAVYCAVTPEHKQAQRQYFFWYDKANRPGIIKSLHRINRTDLVRELFPECQDFRVQERHKNKKQFNENKINDPKIKAIKQKPRRKL